MNSGRYVIPIQCKYPIALDEDNNEYLSANDAPDDVEIIDERECQEELLVVIFVESNYGEDVDGHRGTEMASIEEVRDNFCSHYENGKYKRWRTNVIDRAYSTANLDI